MGVRWDSQCDHWTPPYISCGTSAASPVNQLISLQQTNGNTSGVGHVSGTLDDQVHRPVHIEFPLRDQSLDFDNGRERLTIHPTLLHRKCIGQKLLERLVVETGIGAHT